MATENAAGPTEKSCPRTAPIKGDMGWCGQQLGSGRRLLDPHKWTDMRTGETFWCPGYWHDLAEEQPAWVTEMAARIDKAAADMQAAREART